MTEWLTRHDATEIIGLVIPMLAIIGGVVIAVTAIIACNIASTRKASLEAELKRDMLARGMTVEEIERVVHASTANAEEEEEA